MKILALFEINKIYNLNFFRSFLSFKCNKKVLKMKASEISSNLIGKKIQFDEEVLTWNGKKTYTFTGEIIGVSKTDSFIDVTVYRNCGLPFKNSIHHIGVNFESGYNTIETAKLI